MNKIPETIMLSELMDKLKIYTERKQINLKPSLERSYSKMDASMLKSYLNALSMDIVTEKASPFSHINPVKILNIYPKESL